MRDEPFPDRELEREAVRDVARLMLTWSARLGPGSRLARDLEEKALEALALLEGPGR